MGTNAHALAHRLTALLMACLASTALICCCLSGFGCSFIKIKALNGESIGNVFGDVHEDVETAYLGVQCLSGKDALFYDVDDSVDRLWNISRIFLYTGLGLGVTTALFAWLLGSCIRPTGPRWQILSVLAACSAVFEIPIFLLFESDTCNFDITRQTCELATSAYLNVLSISIWIVMTIWVQFLRVPRWDEELHAWRAKGDTGSSSSFQGEVGTIIGNEIVQSTDGSGKQLEHQHRGRHGFDNSVEETEDKLYTGPENANNSNNTTRRWAEEPLSSTNIIEQNLSNKNNAGKDTRLSFVRSRKNNVQRVRSSGKNESTRNSSEEAGLACNTQQPKHEPTKKTKGYAEPTGSNGYNVGAIGDKSEAVDTGNHAVNQPQNVTSSTIPPSSSNRAAPGFHMSCVHADGTRQEVHFPSLNCCVGMGYPTVEEEESKFQTYPQISDDIDIEGFSGYNDFGNTNSDSPDFLVRKLRREEQAAAARRAELNMAPVASFEFVSRNSIVNGDRRNHRKSDHHDVIINDDVSEMTRGSGWASGVSEILDDTDLRHQPKAILEDLTEHY